MAPNWVVPDGAGQDGQRREATAQGAGGEHRHAAFAARVIRAHARPIARGDVEGLADLPDLAHELDAATRTAVDGLRGFGYSWADIAARLGTTRQAAQQRWGR